MDGQPLLPGEDSSSLDTTQTEKIHQQMIDLLGVLSHEFRTPLAIIATATSMLLRKLTSLEERDEALQMIQQANKRLSTLTDRLLDLAQLEAGAFEVEYGSVNVISIIREVMAHAQQDIPESLRNHFTFQLQCQDEAGNLIQETPEIIADPLSLHKVFAHLLENAVRFSPKGGDILVIIRPASPEQMGSHS